MNITQADLNNLLKNTKGECWKNIVALYAKMGFTKEAICQKMWALAGQKIGLGGT